MRLARLAFAVVALVAVLHGSTPDARAGGGAVGRCETAKASGQGITITFVTKVFTFDPADGTHITVNNITVMAEYKGETFGPFQITSGDVFGVLNAVDAGCAIFNELGLSSAILSATGLHNKTTLEFTQCSFVGPTSGNPCTKVKDVPLGWVLNQVIGYAAN